jgi:hypothetical protein
MGFQIRKRHKDAWTVVFDNDAGAAGRTQRVLKKGSKEFLDHGFRLEMTPEEASSLANTLNSQARIVKEKLKQTKIEKRIASSRLVESAYLPVNLVTEFENSLMVEKDLKSYCWDRAREIIVNLNLDPSDWYDTPHKLYLEFEKLQISPDYAGRILRVLNEWGRYYCKALKKPWAPVPRFRGIWLKKINNAFQKANPGGLVSARLNPQSLEAAKPELLVEDYNWLYISIWFGLRPQEVDSLHNPANWTLTQNSELGIEELRVEQLKLDGEVKVLPVDLPQQKAALEIIKSGAFKRPLYKTVHKLFGKGVKLYGGRKEFANLMDALGYDLNSISSWMGHRSVDTTLNYYKDRKVLIYNKKKVS